jgi:hypothetical protein
VAASRGIEYNIGVTRALRSAGTEHGIRWRPDPSPAIRDSRRQLRAAEANPKARYTQREAFSTDGGVINVSRTVFYFACDVDAGIFCVPRCRRADSPAVNNSGDFSGISFYQGP